MGVSQSNLVGSNNRNSRTATTRCEESPPAPPPAAPPLPSAGGEAAAAPPPPLPSATDSIEEATRSVSAFTNPGPYEQAVSDVKRLVMLDTYDGFRCDINKQVSPFMAAVHTFHLGTTMIPDGRKSTYSFLTQVADEQSLLMARIDPGRGSVDCRVHKSLLSGLAMGKVQALVTQDGQGDQLLAEIDVGGQTWAGNLKYGSMGNGLVYGMNYIQAIHPNIAMGGEGMYLDANQNLISSYSIKFNWQAKLLDESLIQTSSTTSQQQRPPGMPIEKPGQSMLILNYGTAQGGVTVSYKNIIVPNRLTLGGEIQFSPFSLDSHVTLAAEYKWQRSKMNLCVDGTGRIQTLLEAKVGMTPNSPSITFSADVDHMKDEMKFGYGITLDS